MSKYTKIPLSLKIGSILFILGLVLLSFLFLLLIPNINNNQYNNTLAEHTKIVNLTKHQVRLIVDYITEYKSFLRKTSKQDILKVLEDIEINGNEENLQDELAFINNNYNCSIESISNSKQEFYLSHNKIDSNYTFKDEVYNKWESVKINDRVCGTDTYFKYTTLLHEKEIKLTCHPNMENNYKDIELNIKKVLQDGFSLSKDMHKGKVYLMWINNKLDEKRKTSTFTNLENTDKSNFCLSRISNFTEPLTGSLQIKDLLDINGTKLVRHQLNDKKTLTWVSNVYSNDTKDFVLVLSAYEEDFLNHLENPVLTIIPISILALSIAILLGFFIFRKWLRNIEKLSKTAREICNGKLDLRSNITGKDDIGVLGVAFDSMLDKLEDNINTLDSKVVLRTNELQESLQSKETLLKEIHHRVKNNLSLTIYFVQLQRYRIEDKNIQKLLIDIENRIYTMSLVHTKLYESKNLELINMKKYILELSNDIYQSYDISQKICIVQDVDDVILDINYALPCGLIINECLTNSFKYAFTNDEGSITISLKNIDDNIILTISDNGKGLDKEIDIFNVETLGLQLITSITQGQLHGSIDYINNSGAMFIIKFAIENKSMK